MNSHRLMLGGLQTRLFSFLVYKNEIVFLLVLSSNEICFGEAQMMYYHVCILFFVLLCN